MIFVPASSSQPLSPIESDPTDSVLFLSVLLYVDLTVEEMFCLILKCEEICGQSAKSHYSPPCSALLHEANPRKRKKLGEREREGETDTHRENVHTPPDRRVTEIPNAVIVIKVNWLQLAG